MLPILFLLCSVTAISTGLECADNREVKIEFDNADATLGEFKNVNFVTWQSCQATHCLNMTLIGNGKFRKASGKEGRAHHTMIYTCPKQAPMNAKCDFIGCRRENDVKLRMQGGDSITGDWIKCCCNDSRYCNNPPNTVCHESMPLNMTQNGKKRWFPGSSDIDLPCGSDDKNCFDITILGEARWKNNDNYQNASVTGHIAGCSDTDEWKIDCKALGPGCHMQKRLPVFGSDQQCLEGDFEVCCCNTSLCNDKAVKATAKATTTIQSTTAVDKEDYDEAMEVLENSTVINLATSENLTHPENESLSYTGNATSVPTAQRNVRSISDGEEAITERMGNGTWAESTDSIENVTHNITCKCNATTELPSKNASDSNEMKGAESSRVSQSSTASEVEHKMTVIPTEEDTTPVSNMETASQSDGFSKITAEQQNATDSDEIKGTESSTAQSFTASVEVKMTDNPTEVDTTLASVIENTSEPDDFTETSWPDFNTTGAPKWNVSVELKGDQVSCEESKYLHLRDIASGQEQTLAESSGQCLSRHCYNATIIGNAHFLQNSLQTGELTGTLRGCSTDMPFGPNCTSNANKCINVFNQKWSLSTNKSVNANLSVCCCDQATTPQCNTGADVECVNKNNLKVLTRANTWMSTPWPHSPCTSHQRWCVSASVVGYTEWITGGRLRGRVRGRLATCNDNRQWRLHCQILGEGCHLVDEVPIGKRHAMVGQIQVCCCSSEKCNKIEEEVIDWTNPTVCQDDVNTWVKFATADESLGESLTASQLKQSTCKTHSHCYNATILQGTTFTEYGRVGNATGKIRSCAKLEQFDCTKVQGCERLENIEIPTVTGVLNGSFDVCCCTGDKCNARH